LLTIPQTTGHAPAKQGKNLRQHAAVATQNNPNPQSDASHRFRKSLDRTFPSLTDLRQKSCTDGGGFGQFFALGTIAVETNRGGVDEDFGRSRSEFGAGLSQEPRGLDARICQGLDPCLRPGVGLNRFAGKVHHSVDAVQ
ncbi:MAG: hypothetical protein ACK56I_15095, partial [bacterium]